jgi:hypothetical protein
MNIEPSKLYNITRSAEYFCFFPAEIPTREGDVYAFMFVDAYSKFLIDTGMEKDRSHGTILKHIRLFTQHKDFVNRKSGPFILALHKYEEISKEIFKIINPFNGKVLIHDEFVSEQVSPVLEHVFASLAGKSAPDKSFSN